MRPGAGLLGLGVLLGSALLVPAAAQAPDVDARLDALFGAHQPYRDFLAALQQAVAARDKPAVAAMVSYPLRVRLAGHQRTIRGPRAFIALYHHIIDGRVQQAIAQQRYDTLLAKDSGVMIGDGVVWFGGTCSDPRCSTQSLKITAINP
jgi:hypothetical protein